MAKMERMELDREAFFVSDEDNGEIWNQVCQSEMFGEALEEFLKNVSYGTRSYTSIDAYQQIRKATEIFGPFGKGWGISKMSHFGQVPVMKKSGDDMIKGTQIFVLMDCFWMDNNGTRNEVQLLQDIFVDASGDCGKKMGTDCITKFLSYLGFNFDVFTGRFDGSKIVGTAAKDEDIAEMKRLLKELLPEKADSVIDYHERRGWKKTDVTNDLGQLRAKKEAADDAATEDGQGVPD